MGAVAIPILPSSDFAATVAFYSALGLFEAGQWPGQYLILRSAAGVELHFWYCADGLDPTANDSGCYVRYDTDAEVLALYESWAAAGVADGDGSGDGEEGGGGRPRLTAPARTDYGMVEFALIDPMGNLVRIGA
ncbi:MAG TPA: VOC family protein [Acidimicrobiales bacterium]|jgi:catechol 2,3-dioxygenase-like lactoylglutathione lyase family enzyme|nr:VOC family protein [Acidimicrobiales bacterium]